jgi:hypothetical protein
MKDYLRRSVKFILYIVIIFVLVLGLLPLILHGKSMTDSFRELLANNRFTLIFGLLIAYGFVYPVAAFMRMKRHLNGSFAENREKFERAFAALNYIKTEENAEKVVYRRKSVVGRLLQWNEDAITVYTNENPVVMTGFRKSVVRIDRMIDQYNRMAE